MSDVTINDLKRDYKNSITELITSGKIPEAKYMIDEYEKRLMLDADLYSMKSVIAMMEGELDEAGKNINNGLRIDPLHCDLYYNLAYLYELKNEYICAYREYKKLRKICDNELLPTVNAKLIECEKEKCVEEYNQRKKVLLVAYIFPPLGGSGVQRTLKFTKYLRQFGWEPIVVTVGQSNFYFKDDTMLAEVPNDIQIIRIEEKNQIDNNYANELIGLYQGMVQDQVLMAEYIGELKKSNENLNNFLFIPDQKIVWAKEVIKKVSNDIDFNDIDLIYSTSGPYSDHIVGYYLKKKYQKPWVADFRDEWTNNPYIPQFNKNHIMYRMQRKMESNILNHSEIAITVTRLSTENYIKGFNLDKNRVTTITNGYDEDDFNEIEIVKTKNSKFTIMHNGTFYLEIIPETFLVSISNLVRKGFVKKEDLEIIFTFTENEMHWRQYVQKLNLEDVVAFRGYLPHKDSLNLASKADVLLLILGAGENKKSVYTGKVFEYLRLNKPILALSPIGGLVDELIQTTNRGKNLDYDDIKGIEKYIIQLYKKWKEDNSDNLNITDEIKKYEREELTRQLSETFNLALNSKITFDNNILYSNQSEKDNEFYNDIYRNGGWNQTYFKHYTEIHYFPIWTKAIEIINKFSEPNIIDIGCGPGQFAKYVFDSGITQYQGIDFSSEAIKMAKVGNDKFRELFRVDNAYTTNVFDIFYNTVILFEVLEHIDDDLKILDRIRKGSNVLFSVPDFYSDGHVRWFESERDIMQRYNKIIRIDNIYTFNVGANNKIYLIKGIKS